MIDTKIDFLIMAQPSNILRKIRVCIKIDILLCTFILIATPEIDLTSCYFDGFKVIPSMTISEIQEVLMKFRKEEETIDCKIKQANKSDDRILEYNDAKQNILSVKSEVKSLVQAKERNRAILKNLETAKGNLRSKAIFSPSEIQWKEICAKYQSEPALVVSKWKCHLPVYI